MKILFHMLFLLATNPWGLYELWGGGVPTKDIDNSGPSLRHLLLRILLSGPAPPSPPAVQCPSSLAVVFCLPLLPPPQDHLPTWVYPVFVPEYQNPFSLPFLTHHHPKPTHPPLPFPRHACRITFTAASMISY